MFLRLIMVLLVTLLLALSQGSVRAADYPVITLDYSQAFNSTCAEVTKQPIEGAAVEELENRLDSFRESWRKEAPQLLVTTVKLTKVKFQFRESKAALSLCRGFPSMSFPLMIGMRNFLKSLRADKAASMTVFSNTVFHEVLHRYVSDRLEALPGETTLLLTKYRGEPQIVQNHLHLMAIMKVVYMKLGREKDLEEVIAFEQTLPIAAFYNRAREIVDKEGVENFISEIRKSR